MRVTVNDPGEAIDASQARRTTRQILLVPELALLLAVIGLQVYSLGYKILSPYYSFQDFRCYFMAATLKWNSGDPYNSAFTILPFVYTPTTLLFFKSFTFLPIRAAELEWFAVNCLVLFLLIYLWKTLLPLPLGVRQGLLLSCGFTGAIFQSLVTGNVGLVEQLLLWSGLAALLRGRYWLFGACIVVASQFKLLTLLFLPCLFLMNGDARVRRKQGAALLGSIGMFFCTLLANFLVWRTWPHDLAANLSRIDYNGANSDPSSRAFVEDLLRAINPTLPDPRLSHFVSATYLLFIACILGASGWALLKYRRKRTEYDPLAGVLFYCLVTALVLPRLKLYSYVLVLPPAMYMAARLKTWKGAALFVLCLIPTHNFLYPISAVWQGVARLYNHGHIPELVSNYTSLFALAGIWAWYVIRLTSICPFPVLPEAAAEEEA